MNHFHSLPPYVFIRLTGATTFLLPAFEELYCAFAQHEGITIPITQFMDFIVTHLDDEQMLVLLAQVADKVVGYGLAFDVLTHPFIPTWQRCGYITQMFVHEAHQRQGIGQAMVTTMLSWLTQRGVGQVMLNVDVQNEAGERFWRKQGFAPYLLRMKRTLDA